MTRARSPHDHGAHGPLLAGHRSDASVDKIAAEMVRATIKLVGEAEWARISMVAREARRKRA